MCIHFAPLPVEFRPRRGRLYPPLSSRSAALFEMLLELLWGTPTPTTSSSSISHLPVPFHIFQFHSSVKSGKLTRAPEQHSNMENSFRFAEDCTIRDQINIQAFMGIWGYPGTIVFKKSRERWPYFLECWRIGEGYPILKHGGRPSYQRLSAMRLAGNYLISRKYQKSVGTSAPHLNTEMEDV